MRFIFTKENWNKPLLAAIQLDPTVKDTTEAGFLATAGNIPLSWTIVFVMMSILMLVFCIYHYFILPLPYSDTSRYEEAHRSGTPFKAGDFLREFYETFFSFFRKRSIIAILLFLCLFRFAEAQLIKMSSPFMLDSQEKGGLALTTGQVGIAYGTVGWLMQIVGSILGGFLAARDGLKKWVWWMCLAINVPDLVYVFMSYAHPANFAIICTCVAIETFGYGFGFTAYTLYMIQVAEGKHKTAHFAIATGFMALGMMVPGMFSGWIQSIIGYQHFFIWIMLATIPGFLVVVLIKIDPEFGKKKTAKASV
jgi:PAT family beta-lactamase induction signal transducer AmpG